MSIPYGRALVEGLRDDSEGASPTRGALIVAAFVVPALLFVCAVLHDPSLGTAANAPVRDVLRLTAFAIAIPAYGALGVPLMRWVRSRISSDGLGEGFLLAAAVIAIVVSSVAALVGRGEIFFEIGAVALAIDTAGRLFEVRSGVRAGLAVPAIALLSGVGVSLLLHGAHFAWGPLMLASIAAPGALLSLALATAAPRAQAVATRR